MAIGGNWCFDQAGKLEYVSPLDPLRTAIEITVNPIQFDESGLEVLYYSLGVNKKCSWCTTQLVQTTNFRVWIHQEWAGYAISLSKLLNRTNGFFLVNV
jgi:hypothetical protein